MEMPVSSDGCPDYECPDVEEDVSALCEKYAQMYIGDGSTDPFRDAATHLYRIQGRRWLGLYEPADLLCATCFLRREKYIGENGLGTENVFTPMPEWFGKCPYENISATI